MTITYPNHQRNVGQALERGAILDVWPGQTGVAIGVKHGKLWVTQTGDPVDHILSAGESFTAEGRGMLVVEALEQSEFTLP
jgi:hypothetical protein